jgi:hypothetical protein
MRIRASYLTLKLAQVDNLRVARETYAKSRWAQISYRYILYRVI